MKKVEIELISDFICPWCYIGKWRLDRVAEKVKNEIELDITLRPYLLYPQIPPEGSPKSIFQNKTKPGMGKSLRYEAGIEDIELNYNLIKTIPSSFEAHRMVELIDNPKLKYQFAKLVFTSYFQKGLNIGDRDLLSDMANTVGVGASIISIFLNSNQSANEVIHQIEESRSEFISMVPTIRLDRKIDVPGLQSFEVLEQYIRRVSALR